jgi:hypothetical protein
LNLDLDPEGNRRVYGDDWYRMLSNSKATLATESGANLFDFNGDLNLIIEKEFELGHSENEVLKKIIQPLESEQDILMNQISPKVFEAISLRTALILYEGSYSGILKPGVHYIELKKDFSNFNDVIEKIKDDDYLDSITENAYLDIIENGKFSYKNFISNFFDRIIDENCILTRYEPFRGNYPVSIDNQVEFRLLQLTEVNKIKLGITSPFLYSDDYEANLSLSQKQKINGYLKSILFVYFLQLPTKIKTFSIKVRPKIKKILKSINYLN